MEVSVKDVEPVGIIYDQLLEQYQLGARSNSPSKLEGLGGVC